MGMRFRCKVLVGVLFSLSWMAMVYGQESSYRTEIERWREQREEQLKSDNGWLTVAGLFWLKEGENSFGAGPLNDFVLPEGSAPSQVGVFDFHDGKTTVRIEEGVSVKLHDKTIRTAELERGSRNAISVGELKLWVHMSGQRYAIRLRDPDCELRKEFTGLVWFPVNESYRVKARFVPHDAPKKVKVLNVFGDVQESESPGYVFFELDGREHRLEPFSAGENRLSYVFRDLTAGKETYPAARFMTTDGPNDDGIVTIDFNNAYNPPCAFNPFTTCPTPTKSNRLSVRIEAGEKNYHGPGH